MNGWYFLALIQDTVEPSDATRETWRLLEMPAAWVVVLVLLPSLAFIAGLGYWREKLSTSQKATLSSLRFLSLLALTLVLFRPVTVKHQESVKPAEVVVLVDDSASMRRKDSYAGDQETREKLRTSAGRAPEETTRLEQVEAILPELVGSVEQREYDVRLFRFAEDLAPLTELSDLKGKGHATHVGDALERALAAHRGRHVTDFVVVSDGRSNGGVTALDAARGVGAEGIPVHTVVVGDTRPEKNLFIELVEAPTSVLEGDEIALTVRVVSRGSQDAGTTQVVLEEIPQEGETSDFARTLAEETVDLASSGERIVLVAPPVSSGPSGTERRLRISVPPAPGETLLDDNTVDVTVFVTPEKIRVLYIDGYPRYEYRFLNRLLVRSDERISVHVYLMSATPDFIQESTDGLSALRRIPVDRRELLDNYDVIILGDVNPYAISPDPAVGEEFVQSLFEFVERGGGLCLIAGEYENPKTFPNTEFEKLLPVVLDATGSLAYGGDTQTVFRPTLEDPGTPHEIVRLHPDPDVNRRLWEEPGGLSGLFWYSPILDSKPGAQVLLRHPTDAGPHGRYPLLVTGYYPSGRTMFLAIDSTWRWRYRFKDRYHERFWRNAVRWLALGRLKSGDRRYSIDPLKTTYGLDERIVFEARVLDEDYQPLENAEQEAFLATPDEATEEISLTQVDGRPGVFRSSLEAERPGTYRAWIEIAGERVAQTEVEVVLPSRESADPSPDPEGLAALSTLTGGRSVTLASLTELKPEFPGGEERREPISSQLEDAWDNWWTLLGALLLLSIEWVLRKRYELI